MSEPEDERLRAARIKAALAFFGPRRTTLRQALEGAGFTVQRPYPGELGHARGMRVSVELPDQGYWFGRVMTSHDCRLWLLGLPEEWEISEGAYERARERLLSSPEGVSLMLCQAGVRTEAAEARIAELEAEQ